MAGLSSNAGMALKKAMSVEKKLALATMKQSLEQSITNEEVLNAGREQEAQRILSVETYVDGQEVWPGGDLFRNLTQGLDEAGLRSALGIIDYRIKEVLALEQAWIAEQKAIHERQAPHVKFVPDLTRF